MDIANIFPQNKKIINNPRLIITKFWSVFFVFLYECNQFFFTFSDTLYFCNTALSILETIVNNNLIYPNPSVGIFFINNSYFSNDIPIFAKLFDLSSKQLFSEEIKNTSTLNLTNLESGMYILKLEQNNIITTHKVIINKQ